MTFKFSDLYVGPDVNPVNRKARAIPFFNPINVYGRVFFFSWFGFMIAFWAWYTFPPLVRPTTNHLATSPDFVSAFPALTLGLVLQLTATIKQDLSLTPTQVANSNIVSLCVTWVPLVSPLDIGQTLTVHLSHQAFGPCCLRTTL